MPVKKDMEEGRSKIAILAALILVFSFLGYYFIFVGKQPKLQSAIISQETFSLKTPPGWKEAEPSFGSVAVVVGPADEFGRVRGQLSVDHQDLDGRSLEDQFGYLKDSFKKTLGENILLVESSELIQGQKVYFLEIKANLAGNNFGNLTALINGRNNDIWILSFSAPSGDWERERKLFYESARSFRIKSR